MPGLWVEWFPWVVPLVVLDACILDFLFWFPWLPMPGLWAGFGLSLLCPGCGLGFLWMVCLLACMWGLGWMMVVLSVEVVALPSVWGGGGFCFVVFVSGCCPIPLLLGKVLSVFSFVLVAFLGAVKLVCRRCWELLLGPLVWIWQPDYGCVPRSQFSVSISRLLVPGQWVVWFPLCCSLSWFVACA